MTEDELHKRSHAFWYYCQAIGNGFQYHEDKTIDGLIGAKAGGMLSIKDNFSNTYSTDTQPSTAEEVFHFMKETLEYILEKRAEEQKGAHVNKD